MKKIGIMTWYHYRNYGTVLQSSALSYKIQKMGYHPILINYRPRKIYTDKLTYLEIIKKIRISIEDRLNKNYFSEQMEYLYQEYLQNKIQETAPCNSYSELYQLNGEMDAFICGSDQIWSPNNFDEKYFLSFVSEPEKKIAYAPSIGLSEIKNKFVKKKVGKLLSSFKYLSVRETQGASLLKNYYSLEAEVVLDPTLLLKPDEWIEYADIERIEKKIPNEEYMICYFLGLEKRYISEVKRIAKELSVKVYGIPVYEKSEIKRLPFEIGPREFVALIKNAAYVCTDSFHGMAFAINFNIPFTVFPRFKETDPLNQNSRIMSLLDQLELSDRLWIKGKKIEKCDFSISEQILKEKRRQSAEYLERALKEAVEREPKCDRTADFSITELCCGCGTCASICPTKAIKIQRNEEGFQHYVIQKDKCIQCRKCQKVCPFYAVQATSIKELEYLYAFKSRSRDILRKSSSGGAAYEIEKYLREKNYQICGVVYDRRKQSAVHKLVPKGKNIGCFQGSKYLQSDSSRAIEEIYNLKKDERIVFTGTPCQVAGVDKLLKEKGSRQQAVLIDLICHGVPTYYLWKAYLKDLNKRYAIGTKPDVIFRDKIKGEWRKRVISVLGTKENKKNHIYSQKEDKDNFYLFFKNSICNMQSCYECPYRDKSSADIRLGDYWGKRFEKDKTGVSMVIPISQSGAKIVELVVNEREVDAKRQIIDEFFDIQYPYNKPKPYFREELIKQMKTSENVTFVKKRYCSAYKLRERLLYIQNKIIDKK